mmetsp:Transcript_91139/g.244399  ORF Transcript_91139/g.244399 Transcript_91139/m.244399 type:complete len:322 (-) Transcript_91139:132-1097(-)
MRGAGAEGAARHRQSPAPLVGELGRAALEGLDDPPDHVAEHVLHRQGAARAASADRPEPQRGEEGGGGHDGASVHEASRRAEHRARPGQHCEDGRIAHVLPLVEQPCPRGATDSNDTASTGHVEGARRDLDDEHGAGQREHDGTSHQHLGWPSPTRSGEHLLLRLGSTAHVALTRQPPRWPRARSPHGRAVLLDVLELCCVPADVLGAQSNGCERRRGALCRIGQRLQMRSRAPPHGSRGRPPNRRALPRVLLPGADQALLTSGWPPGAGEHAAAHAAKAEQRGGHAPEQLEHRPHEPRRAPAGGEGDAVHQVAHETHHHQ